MNVPVIIKAKGLFVWVVFIVSFVTSQSWATSKIRIACVGSSLTTEATNQNSYPAQLAQLLGKTYGVDNLEQPGTTLLRKGDNPYWNTAAYKQALTSQPQWVFINLGTYDSKPVNLTFLAEFVQDYTTLIRSFQQLPTHPRIVLLLPAPVFSTDTTDVTAQVVTSQIIPAIRQVAYETNCEVINLYNLLIDKPELFPDGIHASAQGAGVITRRLAELIRLTDDATFDVLKQANVAGKPFNFHGFRGMDFSFQDRNAKIVTPKKTAKGHPWVWRARFWGHEPQTDIALLERGFHIVYCDVAELFGNDEALAIWDAYYQRLTKAGLSPKAAMEGMSRGGVYIYRWAAKYPQRVSAVYADAPVLDLKSWPGGKGQGTGSAADWAAFKTDFGLKTEQEALDFRGNPIDLAAQLAKGGYPMLHVVGDADEAVPVDENTTIFEQKINAAGGSIRVIHKPGVKHHPHSLPNPQPIVDFILKATEP